MDIYSEYDLIKKELNKLKNKISSEQDIEKYKPKYNKLKQRKKEIESELTETKDNNSNSETIQIKISEKDKQNLIDFYNMLIEFRNSLM